MRYCNACGAETPEGARFCQNCGAELGARVPTGIADAAPVPGVLPAPTPPTFAAPPMGAMPPAPPYPAPPYPLIPGHGYPPRTNGKAIAGMWIGIASIPGMILTWIGIIIGIVGFVFCAIALNELRASQTTAAPPQAGRIQAIIGGICSIIGIAASTALLIYILNHLDRFGIKLTT